MLDQEAFDDDFLTENLPSHYRNHRVTIGTDQNDFLFSTNLNDSINALSGDDFIQGGRGNDIIDGGSGLDTLSYATLGRPIRVSATGVVSKGIFGFDQVSGVETFIASRLAGDTIDASAAPGGERIDADLFRNKLSILDIPGLPIGADFIVETVVNFENVIGTNNNDKIIGDQNGNFIDGGAGNDTINGGGGRDTLIGGIGIGVNEKDILTGGGFDNTKDIFVLGLSTGAFYTDGNNANPGLNNYALITDFRKDIDTIQLKSGLNYQIGAAPVTLGISGMGIFIDDDGIAGLSANDELIGILQGQSFAMGLITKTTPGFKFDE
jgi:Ca2+-binding RTX toxin-like protein